MPALGKKMAKGAIWMVLVKFTERGVGVLSTMILARLLVPADFGLIAMAMSISAVLEIMGAFSFDLALIQRQHSERRHYDTAWTFNVITALVSAVLLVLLAIPAAHFFNEPRLSAVMVALALATFIQGFENIGIVAFQKDLELHKEFKFRVVKKLAGFVVTIAIAYYFRSYWALVVGIIVGRFAGVALSYALHPFRPRLSLAGRRDLLHFSQWVLVGNVFVFINSKIVDFVIGKLLGSTALGLYSVAYEISNLPTTELVYPISRAVFPGYAQIANDKAALRKGFFDVLAIIVLLAIPIGTGICVLAQPFVATFLGEKWAETVPAIQILAIFGVIRACTSNTGAVYLALGHTKAVAQFIVLNLVFLVPFLFWGISHAGVYGAAWAVLGAAVLQVPVNFFVLLRLLGASASGLMSALWRPLVASVCMAGVIYAARNYWFGAQIGPVLQLIYLVPLGAVVYISIVLVLWRAVGTPDGGEKTIHALLGAQLLRVARTLN